MKKFIYLAIILGTLNFSSNAQYRLLKKLLTEKQYGQLEQEFRNCRNEHTKNVYKAFLLNVWGQAEDSERMIEKISNHEGVVNDEDLRYRLSCINYDNAVKQYHYNTALLRGKELLKKFPHLKTRTETIEFEKELKIWYYLQQVSPQILKKNGISEIPITRDLAGLWTIPVTSSGADGLFVFDTGAGLSCITRTYAKKMNLHLIEEANVEVRGGINQIANQVGLAVAKQISIGKIKVHDAVFLVFPDSALSFANGAYKINGIIGLPIIRAMEQITISEDILMIAEQADTSTKPRNLLLDLLQPIIVMNYGKEALSFSFDTGADGSTFYKKFWDSYKKQLSASAKPDTIKVGGAGGYRMMNIMEASSLQFTINGIPVKFKNAQINTGYINETKKYWHGNIGQDLIKQFGKMTINFKTASISFSNPKPYNKGHDDSFQ